MNPQFSNYPHPQQPVGAYKNPNAYPPKPAMGSPQQQLPAQMQNMHISGQPAPNNYPPPPQRYPQMGNGVPPPQQQQLQPQQPQQPQQLQQLQQPQYPPPMQAQSRPNIPPPQPQTIRSPAHPSYPPTQQPYTNQQPYSMPPNQSYPPTQPQQPLSPTYPPQQQPGYPPPPQQQQAARRIEPDQLPSPIQVMQDDERARSGVFVTNQKGQLAPLATTNFLVDDQGNCSPRYIRSTMYNVPVSGDIMKQTAMPFALILSPMARIAPGENPPPITDLGPIGPVRCIRCKAYMSPFMQFIDGGRRFCCLLCKATTEVPAEYFQHLDHTGLRVDRFERPELMLGAYEFIATKEYCKNNQTPNPPAIIFVIDVSYNSVRSGLVHLLCAQMKNILSAMYNANPEERARLRVGFITYSTSVQFYNLKSTLAAPQMVIVGDVQEMFMPLLDGFLVNPSESSILIDLLMEEIPRQFGSNRETETILLPALQAGMEALKAAECAGKLLVFHTSLPTAEAPGKLKNRDDRKVLGTDKEKTVLTPSNMVYNNLGQECVQSGCSVDLFLFNNAFADLPTIGQVSRLTGGEIYKYTYFQADIDGERFIEDLKLNVSREIAFDCVMRVRTSTGVRPTDFYGHFFMSNTTDIELATIDCDKAIGVEVKHDDKLTEEDGVYIQVAMLYTSISGQRRIRILNLSLKACTQMADMYRCCDLDTLILYYAKQSVYKLLSEGTPKALKEALTTRCAGTLACYRKNCANPSSIGQLILPECMKLLPLYLNTLMKSDAISGGSDMTIDDRSFNMHHVLVMDIPLSIVYFYPRLLALHGEEPVPLRCSYEKLTDDGAYLLDNGLHMFLWVGLALSTEWVQEVFGVPNASQIDSERPGLPVLDTPLSHKIRGIIDETRKLRCRHLRLTVIKQRDKMEIVLKHFLVEDTGTDGSPSYVDFLCHLHKEIRSLLS